MLVVFEGIDCAGKTSLINEVIKSITTRLPSLLYSTTKEPLDDSIRALSHKFNVDTHPFLFAADHINNCQTIIQTLENQVFSQNQNKYLICCDRWTPISSRAYQVFGSDNPEASLVLDSMDRMLYKGAFRNKRNLIEPDLYIWVHPNVEVIRQRLESKPNKDTLDIELLENPSKFMKIYYAYQEIFYSLEKKDKKVIKVQNTMQTVRQDISIIEKELLKSL